MAWCLIPQVANDFKKAILDGRIKPDELGQMSSAERRAIFESIVGKHNAAQVNGLFEGKLLLKNQKQAMVSWARRTLKDNPTVQRDVISKIERLDKVLDAVNENAFLEDLVAQRLGTNITYKEASNIAKLSQQMEAAKQAIEAGGDRLDYGRAYVQLKNYVDDIKNQANKLTLAEAKRSPGSIIQRTAKGIAGNTKSIKASLDNSAIFRQGWKTLWTNPGIWAKNALKTIEALKELGGKNVLNEVTAEIVSRPTYDLMKKAKLDVGVIEEAFPTSLPGKIPILGRAFKASEAAYTGFVRRTRADVFDKYIQIAEKSGLELDNVQLESIGRLTNSLTGRGYLGRLEPIAPTLNNAFFSPRLLKSNIDVLTMHLGQGETRFVKKQAAYNLVKIISGTATVLAIANVLKPGSVEWDMRSADFGKIRIGDTRFDVSGGMASIVVLANRWARNSTKSSITGEVRPLNEKDKKGKPKFGATTRTDVAIDFFSNKLSPVAATLRDIGRGHNFEGDKPTVGNTAENLLVPLPISTYQELQSNPNSANTLLSMILESLGISTNTYSKK